MGKTYKKNTQERNGKIKNKKRKIREKSFDQEIDQYFRETNRRRRT